MIPPPPKKKNLIYDYIPTYIKYSGLKPRIRKKRKNRIIGLTIEGASKDICSSQKW